MDPKNTSDDRNLQVPPRDNAQLHPAPHRDAAAQIMREQINQIYDNGGEPNQPAATTSASPYQQTHSENTDHKAATTTHWDQYHTAWQSYYQQYYERYYVSQLHKRTNQLATTSDEVAPAQASQPEKEITKDQAVGELRDNLMNKVRERGVKARKSRHFMPIAAAVLVALVFIFLQYNSLIFAQVKAYVSPGSINPQNIIIDPTTDVKVGPDPLVLIPKINVQAPVIYGIGTTDEKVVEDKLHGGVVQYPIPGADAVPGEVGNTVILGHSSNDVFDNGGYKFIFVQLDKLQTGDTFYLNYLGTRYTYSVTEKKIINPNEVSSLVINNGKPLATLVTCTPPGTALQRLVVIGEQISPDPGTAKAGDGTSASSKPSSIPGNAPSFLERLFGGGN